jgi:hypothetical protein
VRGSDAAEKPPDREPNSRENEQLEEPACQLEQEAQDENQKNECGNDPDDGVISPLLRVHAAMFDGVHGAGKWLKKMRATRSESRCAHPFERTPCYLAVAP